jgi:hypothetical protein
MPNSIGIFQNIIQTKNDDKNHCWADVNEEFSLEGNS